MWLFLIHVFVVIILWVIYTIARRKEYDVGDTFLGLALIFSFILFGHGVVIGVKHFAPERRLLSLQAERDAIVYEIDNDILVGDVLIDFNKYLIEEKWSNANPWLNWYVCDVVDEIDLIETK